MGPYDRFPYHKPLFSQVLHRVGFIHFQYHMKALWQSNYMHSIIIGSLRHQSIYSRVQQLYNHRYYGYIILYHICLLLEIFHFHVPKEDCRAVTWFGFVNCLLTPVMSGSLACWKTQSTVLQYRNLSTGLSTGLHWHRRPFWFWKIGHLKKNPYVSISFQAWRFYYVNATDFLTLLFFLSAWKYVMLWSLQHSKKNQ